MREHQIVITLKPEQFLEVQRLSRAAGAKSMGMFVRQKLLAALGIEGTALPPANAAAGPDMLLVAGELKRLHAELKTFVAESLSQAYVREQPEAPYQAVAEPQEAPSPGEGLPAQYDEEPVEPPADAPEDLSAVSERSAEEPRVFAEAQDKLEQFARRAFAISPRLGAIETPGGLARPSADQVSAKRDPLEDLLEDASAAAPERTGAGDRQEVLPEELIGEGDDEADEDAVFDVPLSLSERARRARAEQPALEPPPAPPDPPPPRSSSGPPDLSGGPPPKRRQ
jgi:hypothetical protein